MNQEIFKVKKISNNSYVIEDFKVNNQQKKISTRLHTIYQYKNLQLHVSENNEKECIKVDNIGHKIISNIIMHSYKITTVPLTAFPFIDKYDCILEQIIETYNYKDKPFAYIQETNTKTNESITYIKVTDFDENKTLNMFTEIVSQA
jgi:hypothetical protein